jgi:hypothetical protein
MSKIEIVKDNLIILETKSYGYIIVKVRYLSSDQRNTLINFSCNLCDFTNKYTEKSKDSRLSCYKLLDSDQYYCLCTSINNEILTLDSFITTIPSSGYLHIIGIGLFINSYINYRMRYE